MPGSELAEKMFSILKECVSRNTPIYYSELYQKVGLDNSKQGDRNIGSQLLEAANLISRDFMISSFAVSKSGNSPYDGFYTLAQKWGRIKPELSDIEKEKFWIAEMKKVYNKYKK